MSDQLEKHIGALTLGSDAIPEDKPPGLFDGGDSLLEEIPETVAVPPGVDDEQAKVFAEASGEKKADPVDEGTQDYKALYEETQRESRGRMGEIDKLRGKLGETNQSIEGLREIFLAREQAEADREAEEQAAFELEEERRLYGEEVVDDPAVSYMRDKWTQTQEMIENQDLTRAQQQQAFAQRAANISQQNANFAATKAAVISQEEAFAKEKPDYYAAYQFARDARVGFYKDVGWDEQQAHTIVNQEEEGIRQQQLGTLGGSVPKAVYAIAERFGWTPDQAQGAEKPVVAPAAPNQASLDAPPNFNKLRAGVGSRGSGDMPGTAGSSRDKRMTAAEFYDTVPIATRIAVQSDPDKFEELGRTGFITVDW